MYVLPSVVVVGSIQSHKRLNYNHSLLSMFVLVEPDGKQLAMLIIPR